ncbi:AraC family transcriptional regulator [Vagococcus intermedius]|uniref:AraC family transcriptional regulator n=1 Tax=Vagococcus intermedius TaxID=2991418 RepID=A0AAF0CUV3_9ENTE|nr:AraC family transcriptional regulator [Vagococcus intermedius]WEG73147.1 AraC family transcriptional regulator [Vagococcus intermedius]
MIKGGVKEIKKQVKSYPYTAVDYVRDNLKVDEVKTVYREVKTTGAQTFNNVTIVYILKGTAGLWINGRYQEVSEGQLLLLMSYHIHQWQALEAPCFIYECRLSIGLLLLSNTSKKAYQRAMDELEYQIPCVKLHESEQVEAAYVMKKLTVARESYLQWADELFLVASISTLIYLFLTGNKQESTRQTSTDLGGILLEYLHQHHQQNLTPKKIAKTFDLTPTEVVSHLKQLTGKNFGENLRNVRLINATALLEFGGLSINQIGRIVGFGSAAYFYDSFKKEHGMTPACYRKENFPSQELTLSDDAYDAFMVLYTNYQHPLLMSEVTKGLNLTPRQFNQHIQKGFQLSPQELLIRIRVSVGRGLLLGTERSISDIGESVGYQDPKQFRCHFKKVYGVLPSDYRYKK